MSYFDKYIHTYSHNGDIGVLVEFSVRSGSITARMTAFQELVKDVSMHIAFSNPANLEELLGQPFVKNTSVTVAQHISNISAQLKEKVGVTRFVRWDNFPSSGNEPPPDSPAAAARLAGRK